jgi:hypothetical protein
MARERDASLAWSLLWRALKAAWIPALALLAVVLVAVVAGLGFHRTETDDFLVHYKMLRRGDHGSSAGVHGVAGALAKLQRWNTSRALEHCAVNLSALRPKRLPRHPQGRCFVSDKYRLVYVLVPKAGSSTSRAICMHYGMARTTLDELTPEQREYFTFGFWREPLGRLPSAFGTLLARAGDSSGGGGGGGGGSAECHEFVKFAGETPDERDRLCRDMFTEEDGFHLFTGAS